MSSSLIVSVAQRPDFAYINNRITPLNVSGEDALALLLDRRDAGEINKIWVSERIYKRFEGTMWKSILWTYKTSPTDGGGFDEFDRLNLFTQKQNFFGGSLGKTQFAYMLSLMQFSGGVCHYVNDPLFLNYNEISETFKRMSGPNPLKADFLSMQQYVTFRDMLGMCSHKGVITHALSIFPNVTAPINQNLNAHLEFSDVIRYTHRHVRKYGREFALQDKKHDCIYVGIKRPDRMKKLRAFKKQMPDHFFMYGPVVGDSMIKTPETMDMYKSSIANVVLGDAEHSNTGLNHRLIQGLSAGSVTFVERSLDPNETLILDPNLRDLLYFSTPEELAKKYERVKKDSNDYHAIIKRQFDELERIMNEQKMDLINRTSVHTPQKVI